jgi:hypothetical protein
MGVTGRERFLAVMSGSGSVPPPLWGDGIREDVREEWQQEGIALDYDIDGELGIDRHDVVQPDIGHPTFALIPPRETTPSLISSADSLDRYPEDWGRQVERFRDRSYAVGLRVSRGLFLSCGVEDWRSLAPLLYEIKDAPDRIAARMSSASQFAAEVLETAYEEIGFDFVLFSEPIASNFAPVISSADLLAVCGEGYCLLGEQARSHGVTNVLFQTYGNTPTLLPAFLACGATAFWSGEVGPSGVSYPTIRERNGDGLGLIGGLDMSILTLDEAEMEHRVREFVLPLIENGRYLPLLDGRVRTGVPFRAYRNYRKLLARLIEDAFRGVVRSGPSPN